MATAYESGRRQPSLRTLAALIDATGHDLLTTLRPQPEKLAMLSGPLGRRIRLNREQILALAAAHGISNVHVFGSVARGDERSDSDVDLLVDLPPSLGLFALGQLRSELEEVLHAPVDLIPAQGLKPEVRERVTHDLIAL